MAKIVDLHKPLKKIKRENVSAIKLLVDKLKIDESEKRRIISKVRKEQ